MSTLIYDLSFSDLALRVTKWEEPGFRAMQIWEGLYRNYWDSTDQFSSIPRQLRFKLAEDLIFNGLKPSKVLVSADKKTEKTLFTMTDGHAIEVVLMNYQRRRTLCISTQVGCAMGCAFCATGQMGFKRHLTSGEIVSQVIHYARSLSKQSEKLTNVVIMGMGEPFHNYNNTLAAIDRLNDPRGYNYGERRFTLSTVGLIPSIRRFSREKRQINLAISLHAADDSLRSSMMPVNHKYPIDELLDACKEYSLTTGRRITFEWALISRVNDTPEQAHLLAKKLRGLLCHVNAIPLNPTVGYHGQASPRKSAHIFKEILERHGISCTIRLRRGIEIQAGCGQLASHSEIPG